MATTQRVGSIYEVGINGVGYMLADNPQRPVRRQTGVLDTQPPGSDDPLSERIGRYDFIGASDWTGGEGQEMLDRPRSDVTRYAYSEGVDPFTVPGRVTCLPEMGLLDASSYATQRVITTNPGPIIWRQTSATELTHTLSGVDTTFTAVGAGSITGLATDGEYWYTANTTGIRRGNTAANPGADWSTVNARDVAWIGDRLGALTADTPPAFTTLSTVGVEENAGGWAAHPDSVIRGLCGGDGFAWWGVITPDDSDLCHIHYWQVDSDPINHGIALVLPPGETVGAMFFYLGNVFIRTVRGTLNGYEVKIYRCVPSDGVLTPSVAVQEIMPTSASSGATYGGFAGQSKFVAFGWTGMETDGANGIGVIDLETGGYARWYATTTTTAALVYVSQYSNDFIITVAGAGLYGPSTITSSDDLVTGFLITSTSDLGTPALKHLDEIQVSTLPLPSGASLAVAYSVDGGANYTTLDTYTTAAATRHFTQLTTEVKSASFRMRATLTPTVDESQAPTVTSFLAKTHATGIVDEIIELPINCEDHIADVNGAILAEDSGPGKGMARYRALRALIGTKVEFQDVDWKHTGTTTIQEVVAVESTAVQIFNSNRQVNDVTNHVAVVTLRSPYDA
jgi:hypothetical protein